MHPSSRRFVVVARPRILVETLLQRYGLRRVSTASVGELAAGGEMSQLNLVQDFRGRGQEGFPCLSRFIIHTIATVISSDVDTFHFPVQNV